MPGDSPGLNFFDRAAQNEQKKTKKKSSSKKKSTAKKKLARKNTVKKARQDNQDTFDAGLVFVAMSFNEKGMGEVFGAIKDTCTSLNLRARRVDEIVSSGFIILEIVDLIKKAEFIIIDLTHERPNVYYELGYAHGVGNSPSNILLLAKDGTQLHFDIAALRVRFYKSTESIRSIVKESLQQMITATR